MRVLIYGFTGTVLGGIEIYILNMNEHMSNDCVFDYIMDGEECVFRERIENRGGRILYVPWARKHPYKYIMALWRILGKEKKHGTKILYQQVFTMSNLIPAYIAKLRGYKVILHAHNNGLQKGGVVYKTAHHLGKHLARICGFTYFTNSQLSTDFMFGKSAKAEMIYNAIDTKKFSFKLEIRNKIREEIGCGDKTVYGFVGRLVNQKNPLFMLRVFNEICKLQPNSELWIIGEGELRDSMKNDIIELGIGDCIKWLGRRNDVSELMQGMDVLLQPSLFEGLGIVLIEAQATGLLTISSEIVIPNEAIISDRIRLLPLNETPSFWAESICTFINENTDKENRAHIRIPDSFNIDYEAKRLESLLKNTVKP